MDSLIHDLKVGLRLLWKDRSFTATVAVTLALCIGANVALFSVVSNVLLRPLPMPESGRIAIIGNAYPKAGAANLRANAVPDYFDRLRETTAFEEQALYNNASVNIDQDGTATRVRAMNVTPSFFRVLGVQPFLGRTFTDAEGELGNQLKIVLSYGLWQSAFGGDASIVGRDVRIDGTTYTVVGVMPQDFVYQRPDVMLWRALAFTPIQKSDQMRHSNNFQQIARLKPGATFEQAQAEIDRLNAANLERFPQFKEVVINAGFHTLVSPLQDDMVRDVRTTLYLMWGGALFVLLIGCVNVANLVLVRSRARLKELATRVALGAQRSRIARQLITESLMLALVSSAVGLAVGWGALRLLGALNIQELPRGSEIRLDLATVAVTLAAGALIGFVLGLIPTAAVLPSTVTTMLREEGRTGTSGRGARLLRRGLVVAQVAFAFVLLAGAGLLFSSFQRVLAVDPGFRPDHVLTGSVVLPRARFRENSAMSNFLNESLQRIRALPGVEAAGTTGIMPLSGSNNNSVIFAEGYQMKPGESAIAPSNTSVSPGFFEAMGVQLVSGRFFDDRDVALPGAAPSAFGTNQPRVVIVDDRLARRFWPGQRSDRPPHVPADRSEQSHGHHPADGLHGRGRRHQRDEAAEPHAGGRVRRSRLLPGPPGHATRAGAGVRPQLRDQDVGRPGRAGRRTAADDCLARSGARAVRCAADDRTRGPFAGQPAVAGRPLADVWRDCAAVVGDRHLRRAGVRRHPADARDRNQARARQQRPQDLRPDPSRRPGPHRGRIRAGGDRGDGVAPESSESALPDLRDRSHCVDRRRGAAGAGGSGRLRIARAPGHPNRSGRGPC